jgi:hypothetical protein
MATPRPSVVLVIVGVLLVMGGGGVYFFFVYSKGEDLRAAQAQVEAWEPRWVAARDCLIGETPRAAEFADALAVRELEEGVEAAIGKCGPLVGKLARPEGNQSGIEEVEEAWQLVEDTGAAVAARYVTHLHATGEDRSLAEALQRLRKARGTLRRVVGLTMEDRPMGPAIAELAVQPLLLGGAPIKDVVVARGEGLGGQVAVGDGWFAAKMTTPGTFVGPASHPEVLRAAPEPGWGVRASFDSKKEIVLLRLLAGPLDDHGDVSGGALLASSPASLIPGAAIGTATRAVLYRADGGSKPGFHLALSKDAGRSWQTSELSRSTKGNIFADGRGNADLLWDEALPGKVADDPTLDDLPSLPVAVAWQRVSAAQLPALGPVARVPEVSLVQACAAPAAPWALLRGEDGLFLVRMDRVEAITALPGFDPAVVQSILACDDDAVILGGDELTAVACQKGVCSELPRTAEPGVAAVVGGVPLRGALHGSLLAVSSLRPPTRFIRVPASTSLYAIWDVGGAPYVVLKRATGELIAGALPK